MPTTSGADNSYSSPPPNNAEFSYPPDIKLGLHELCPVCGDKVSGYHYGLLTCESCKGFFKRTVQNKKVYSCIDNRGCQIDKSQRKRCPYCRFQKCLIVGMKLEAVREDRMRGGRNKFGPMYKRDRAMKQQALKQQQQFISACQMHGWNPLTEDVKPDHNALMKSISFHYQSIPNPIQNNQKQSSVQNDIYSNTSQNINPAFLSGTSKNSFSKSILPKDISTKCMTSQSICTESRSIFARTLYSNGKDPVNISTTDVTTYSSNDSYPSAICGPSEGYSNTPDFYRNFDVNQNVCPPLNENQSFNNRIHTDSPNYIDINKNTPDAKNKNISKANGGGPPYEQDLPFIKSNGMHCNTISNNGDLTDGNTTFFPKLIHHIQMTMLDEIQVRNKLMSFIQADFDNVNLTQEPQKYLNVLCHLADQCLFLMVEWARNSLFFKDLHVDCQMKLLHHCWCEILLLDFVHRQMQNANPNNFILASGHAIPASSLDHIGLADIRRNIQLLSTKLREIVFDYNEYSCLKMLILLNPDRSTSDSRLFVEQYNEQINAALIEYTMTFHSSICDKFGLLVQCLPEIRVISLQIEEYLYVKHLSHEIPEQTLLMEMLHSKHK